MEVNPTCFISKKNAATSGSKLLKATALPL